MWRFLAIFYFLFIAFIHLIPSSSIPEISFADFFQLDKLIHFIIFLIAYLILDKAYSQYYFNYRRFFLAAFCFFYAFLMEFLQASIGKNRNGDALDFLADILGVLFGLYLSVKMIKRDTIIKQKD
jgi:hypothetical protein